MATRKAAEKPERSTRATAAAAQASERAPLAGASDAEKRLRRICLALPEVTERLSHGAPCFFVRDKKSFVMFWVGHHGDGRVALWCAAPPGAQDALTAADPERFFVPPYLGFRGWIGMRLDGAPDWAQVAAVVEDAYRRVAPPKLATLLDG